MIILYESIQMDIPKNQMRFCPFCRKHTMHDVHKSSSSKNRGVLTHGQRIMTRKMKGYGSFPRSNPKGRAKPTKKLDLRYKCSVCKKEHNVGKGFRIKKFEIKKKM
jgi:large subunit ribosomal protein L44e